jgi:hypothetical protein
MSRLWVRLGVLALLAVAGCDEPGPKGNADQKASDVGQKSLDHTRNMTGVAPPEGLQ